MFYILVIIGAKYLRPASCNPAFYNNPLYSKFNNNKKEDGNDNGYEVVHFRLTDKDTKREGQYYLHSVKLETK